MAEQMLRHRYRHERHVTLTAATAWVALCLCCTVAFAGETDAAKSTPAEWVKQGRQLFEQTRYADALALFEKALDEKPASKEFRTLAATAAFWARKPARSLDYWNRLYDAAPRGGDEEWTIEINRVPVLAALGKTDAADMAVERLHELRSSDTCLAARIAKGFNREYFFGQNMRAGCWEEFDERGDAPAIWTVIVQTVPDPPPAAAASKSSARQEPPQSKRIATLAVNVAGLPGGGPGYVFLETTGDATRVYKRWTQRPAYPEVRALILAVLKASIQPLEEKTLSAAPIALAIDDDDAVPQEIKDMALVAQAETIVFTAWKLRGVQADVTRLSRIAPGDNAALEEYFREFNAKYPRAAAAAGELSELVSAAKAEHVRAACDKVLKMTQRSAYMEFAMLTALNSRDRDIPPEIMAAFSKSADFLVRETTALILARHGQRHGVEMLFDELAKADARGCELITGTLDELIGHVLDSPPNSKSADTDAKLMDWKKAAAEWRTTTLDKLDFNAKPKTGEPYWATK